MRIDIEKYFMTYFESVIIEYWPPRTSYKCTECHLYKTASLPHQTDLLLLFSLPLLLLLVFMIFPSARIQCLSGPAFNRGLCVLCSNDIMDLLSSFFRPHFQSLSHSSVCTFDFPVGTKFCLKRRFFFVIMDQQYKNRHKKKNIN